MSQIRDFFRKKWVLWLIVILTSTCCAVAVFVGYTINQLADFAGVVSCDEFQYDFLEAQLPPSAEVLSESCSEGFGPSYKVTFKMASEDLTTFQQQPPVSDIEAWQTDMSDSFFSEESQQGWKENLEQYGAQLNSLLYGQFSDGATLMHILIDTSDPAQYYVQYSASFVD